MPIQHVQEHHFAISTLSICGVLKRVKDFLQRGCLFGLLIDCPPDDSISLTVTHEELVDE
jgi:hypothetical protein